MAPNFHWDQAIIWFEKSGRLPPYYEFNKTVSWYHLLLWARNK